MIVVPQSNIKSEGADEEQPKDSEEGNMSSKSSTPTSIGGSAKGRNKIALKPGKSLMDWIRFTHSGVDLTSVGGKVHDVSADELGKHNKKEDAWICLRGKVYNVTPYLEYHPGGEDELMRGAGKDATDLFNEIHRWVNAESMLQKCFVGQINMSSLWLQKATAFPTPKLPMPVSKASALKSVSCVSETDGLVEITRLDSEKRKSAAAMEELQTPKFYWSQTERSVSISICSQDKNICLEDVIIDLVARDLYAVLRVKKFSYNLHMELEGIVSPVYDVKIGDSKDTAEIIFSKDSSDGQWEEFGKPLKDHDTFVKILNAEIRYRPCKLISKTPVTYNTVLLTFELPSGTKMMIPVGHHVLVKACIDDVEIVRSYTPVLHSLDIPSSHSDWTEGRVICLMIKIYPEGALTPLIGKCKIGESLLISDYLGDFPVRRLKECTSVILLAAGTGFTPMVKLISWVLELDKHHDRPVKLAFFNRTERDILWKNELDSLCQKYTSFQVHHILSEAEEEWVGIKGRISLKLLQDLFPCSFNESGMFVCVCGPSSFTQLTLQYLEQLGCSKDSVHAFCG